MEGYLANTYKRLPLEIVRGRGALAYDAQGKEYIDLGSGIGVNLLGYCDEGWVQAVTDQLQRFQHCSNLYESAPAAELARLLCEKTGMSRVFFSNSGAEANECAIKVARKWAETEKGLPESYIITLNRSFHGRTIAALSATGQEVYHRDFAPLLQGFLHCEVGDREGLQRLLETYPCSAIMMEVVQGEGGVMPIGQEFADFVQKCADSYNILLITDEVQLGNGRSGKLYGYMHYGLHPDIITTAKGLGGGLPIGATLLGERVAEVLQPGMHGSTFGGNPVACAGGVEIMHRLDADFLKGVEERSAYIIKELEQAEGISQITGLGLMLGFVPPVAAREFAEELLSEGVLVTTAKDKIRLLPPLNIPMDVLKTAVQTIKRCAAAKGGTP
jgi:acetylornithine/N-succinyldiaminopimelate aminotransferase